MRAFILLSLLAFVWASNVEQQIVGGSNAATNQFPWQLSLRAPTSHNCGAIIVAMNKGVTAAHCVTGSSYTIRAGTNSRTAACSGNCQERTVTSLTRHPSYGSGAGSYPNDVATLRFSALSANAGAAAVALASTAQDSGASRTGCHISGWGRTCGSCALPASLVFATTNIITNAECANHWGASSLNSGHVCVFTGNNGACNGDSGGPLTCSVSGTIYVFGATSWGGSGCPVSRPSVYTRISFFNSWINTN